MSCCCDKEKLFNSGVLTEHGIPGATLPPAEKWENKKGGYVIIECPKRIPCNPCATSCPTGAVLPFEDINDIVKPIMQQFGFAVSFRVETVQAGMSVTGILMHRAGHREQTTMLLPLDSSGSKNAVQALGSSVSYGKRYVLCALLNITTRGEDDDGNAAVPQKKMVTPAQAKQLDAMLAQCMQDTQDAFDAMYGSTESVPAVEFDATLARLTKARERAQRNAKE